MGTAHLDSSHDFRPVEVLRSDSYHQGAFGSGLHKLLGVELLASNRYKRDERFKRSERLCMARTSFVENPASIQQNWKSDNS